MLNLKEIEELRNKEEIIKYFKFKNLNVTEEEIDNLKRNYEKIGEKIGSKLTLKQLDDVAGGVLVAVRIKIGNTEYARTAQKIYSTNNAEDMKIIKSFLALSGKNYEDFKWMFEPEKYDASYAKATTGEKILEATQIPVIYLHSNKEEQELTEDQLKPENLSLEEVYTCDINNLSHTYYYLGERSPFSPTSIGKFQTNDEFEKHQKNNAVGPDKQAKANKQVYYENQGSEQKSQTPVHDAIIDNFIKEFVIVKEENSSVPINNDASHAHPHHNRNKISCLGIPMLMAGIALFASSIGYSVYTDLEDNK